MLLTVGPCFVCMSRTRTMTHIHSCMYVGDVMHIPADVSSLLHMSTVGGINVTRKVAMAPAKTAVCLSTVS